MKDLDPSTAMSGTSSNNSAAQTEASNRRKSIEIPKRNYKPYTTTYLETPLWSRIMEPLCLDCFQPAFRYLYHIRGFLAPPFRTPIVPRIILAHLPWSRSFPLARITVGDLVLVAPLLVFLLRGIHYTFVSPSLNLSGEMASLCLYLCFVTASKTNSPFSFFLGIPYERLVGLHWMSAVFAGVLGGFHAYVAYNYGGDDDGDSEYSKAAALGNPDELTPNIWKFLWDGQSNWSGTVLVSSMMAMVLSSWFSILRRYLYNLWYFLHILLGVAVVVMLFLHSVFSAVFVTAWWALDIVVRYGVLAQETTMAELRLIGPKPDGDSRQSWEPAVEIKVAAPPGFNYNAGQFVRIAVPAISPVEFHPISISSAPHQDILTLHIRRLGDWTDKLVQFANENKQTPVRIEGPYGNLSVDLEDDFKYKIVLFVSGGIGVTPCQSVGKELLWAHRQQGRHLKKLRFVWAVRDMQMVHDIPPLLLDQEPTDNYSTRDAMYQRMVDRSSKHFQAEGSSRFDMSSRRLDTSSRRLEQSGRSESVRGTGRRRPAVVQADIYCTKTDSDTEATQGLPYNVHQGRPDLDRIFEDMKATATLLGETNIAVIGCGPQSLMNSLQEACSKHSASVVSCKNGGIFFDLHLEHFDL